MFRVTALLLPVVILIAGMVELYPSPAKSSEMYIIGRGLYDADACVNSNLQATDMVMSDIHNRAHGGYVLSRERDKYVAESVNKPGGSHGFALVRDDAWNTEDLVLAISRARQLALEEADSTHLIIYLPRNELGEVNALMQGVLQITPLTVEIRLVDTGCGAYRAPEGAADIRLEITRLSVPASGNTGISRIIYTVILDIESYLGLPEHVLSAETNLITDLQLEHADVFDVVAYLCEKYTVPLPHNQDLATVGDIARYLVDTPTEVPADTGAGATRGGESEQSRMYIQPVYFATDRKQESIEKGVTYNGERALDGRVTFGVCIVSIPPDLVAARSQRKLKGVTFSSASLKQIQILSVDSLDKDTYWQVLAGQDDKARQDIAVFIHGYKMPFEKAVRRAAQFAFDTEFGGITTLFSWPSNGGFLSYESDREDVAWSASHIEQYLGEVRAHFPDARLHLIAHSMGSQGLLQALNMMAIRNQTSGNVPFFSVILAAPDFDAQLFKQQIAPRVIALSQHWTVYASENDTALDISAQVNGTQRLGTPVTPVAGVDTVDASDIEVSPWSIPEFHSYYATKQVVLRDIRQALGGIPASARGLTERIIGNLKYWQLMPGSVVR